MQMNELKKQTKYMLILNEKQEKIKEISNINRVQEERKKLRDLFVREWKVILVSVLTAKYMQLTLFKNKLDNIVGKLAKRKLGYFFLRQRQMYLKGKNSTLIERQKVDI